MADTIHVMCARPGRIMLSRKVDLPRPRDLDICFDACFTKIVYELRINIAEARQKR